MEWMTFVSKMWTFCFGKILSNLCFFLLQISTIFGALLVDDLSTYLFRYPFRPVCQHFSDQQQFSHDMFRPTQQKPTIFNTPSWTSHLVDASRQNASSVPFRKPFLRWIFEAKTIKTLRFLKHPATIDVSSEKTNISHPTSKKTVGKMKRSFPLLLGICDSRFLGGDLFSASPESTLWVARYAMSGMPFPRLLASTWCVRLGNPWGFLLEIFNWKFCVGRKP